MIDTEKENRIKYLKNSINRLSKFDKQALVISTFTSEIQCKIFNDLKKRQGDKVRITFMNTRNLPVEIQGASISKNQVVLNCIFCKTRQVFKMWLETFLKDGIKVKPQEFYDAYLVTVEDKLNRYKTELTNLEN